MTDSRTTAELKAILNRHNTHIAAMRKLGALDVRSERIAENNAYHIMEELRLRGEL